jgi:hypothetical protein
MPLSPTDRFEKQYLNKGLDEQKKVDETLEILEQNPRYPGLHARRVRGTKKIWECYIDDRMRITFEYGKGCIILRNNCKHDISGQSP